jgi:hypothetical protein
MNSAQPIFTFPSSAPTSGSALTYAPTSITLMPTSMPTYAPTYASTSLPTYASTYAPTDAPTSITSMPTYAPTMAPTQAPTFDDETITYNNNDKINDKTNFNNILNVTSPFKFNLIPDERVYFDCLDKNKFSDILEKIFELTKKINSEQVLLENDMYNLISQLCDLIIESTTFDKLKCGNPNLCDLRLDKDQLNFIEKLIDKYALTTNKLNVGLLNNILTVIEKCKDVETKEQLLRMYNKIYTVFSSKNEFKWYSPIFSDNAAFGMIGVIAFLVIVIIIMAILLYRARR